MKYLCLICSERPHVMEFRPPADAKRHFAEYLAFTDGIRKNGHFVGANRLRPPETAVTVRVRNGKVSTPPTARSPKPRSTSAAIT